MAVTKPAGTWHTAGDRANAGGRPRRAAGAGQFSPASALLVDRCCRAGRRPRCGGAGGGPKNRPGSIRRRRERSDVGTPRGLRDRLGTALAWLAAVCAVLVLLGSCEHGTTRVWDGGAPGYGTVMTEGAGRWAGWTFLCGAAALGTVGLAALVVADDRRRGWGMPLAVLTAAPFATAAALAGRYWLRLLDERERDRDYALGIAIGLPVVTIAGAVGFGLALLLAGLWFPASDDDGSDAAK